MTISVMIMYALLGLIVFGAYWLVVMIGAGVGARIFSLPKDEFEMNLFSLGSYLGIAVSSALVNIVICEEKVPYIAVFVLSMMVFIVTLWILFNLPSISDDYPYKVKFRTAKVLLDTQSSQIAWADYDGFKLKDGSKRVRIKLSLIDYLRYCLYIHKLNKGSHSQEYYEYEQATKIVTSIINDYIEKQKKEEEKYKQKRVDILEKAVRPFHDTGSVWELTMTVSDEILTDRFYPLNTEKYRFDSKVEAKIFMRDKVNSLYQNYRKSYPLAEIYQQEIDGNDYVFKVSDFESNFNRCFDFYIREVKQDVI